MKFLNSPNLPENDVSVVIASNQDNELLKALSNLSIKVVPTTKKAILDTPICSHGDLLIHHLGNKSFIIDESQKEIIKYLESSNCTIIITDKVKSPYPIDCLLNSADIGDYIICNEKITDKNIFNTNKTIINVKQGYAKCSICIAGRNIIITDDISIYNAVKPNNITSLLIEKGSVAIEKYNYGFIGGCSGLIGKNKLFFNGDLSLHKNYNEIHDFLKENDVSYFDIKNKPLTDIGSILPIIERM